MAESLADFCDRITGPKAPAFAAAPWYNPAGDCIHFHWRDDEFYRDWVDDKLTVYRSLKNNDAVGCQIKGIAALQQKIGEFGIAINEKNGVPLAIFLFVSHHASADLPEEKLVDREKIYKYLLEQIGKQTVAVPPESLVSA